jgi:hypothetical protein
MGSALGREGLVALATYVGATAVLVSGAWVSLTTWADRREGLATLPWDVGPGINLRLFWFLLLAALGCFGWLLSAQVTKPTLRAYVVSGLALLLLLLVTIGRNGNYEQAASDAHADARRLLLADTTEEASAGGAFLLRLCEEGGVDRATCRNASGVRPQEPVGEARSATPVRCLPGWTLGAVDRWLTAASYDRQIVALRALASCEIGLLDPAAQDAEGEALDVEVADTTTVPADRVAPTGASSVAPGADELEPSTTVPGSEAVVEAMRVQRSEVEAYESVALGADEILSFASGPSHFAEFRFSGAAWLVLLGLLLVWYRHLEIRAGARRLGPVDVQFEPVDDGSHGSSGDTGARRRPSTPVEAVFKESVIRNVPEPGSVPGSGALAPVGDLVAASDLPQRTIVAGVIEVLQMIFATKGGFTVTCSVRAGQDTHSVFVRLRDTRTGHHLASYLAEAADPDQAARLAGYWIAGWIISRSAYVPGWAKWNEDDAADFVATGWEQGDALSMVRQRRVVTTRSASNGQAGADGAPTAVNALLLAQLAYAHQLDGDGGDHFAALEAFARAVHREPRYPVARYRRGVVLGTMMLLGGSVDSARGRSHSDTPVTASRLRYLFGDLVLGTDGDRDTGDRGTGDTDTRVADWCDRLARKRGAEFPADMREAMLVRVGEWARENRVAMRWRWLARLRPSERFFWQSFSRGNLEKDWTRMADLERHTSAERLRVLHHRHPELTGGRPDVAPGPLPDRITRRAKQPDSHWQLSYNIGCFHAIRSDRLEGEKKEACRQEAMMWLERSLDRPWSAQLTRQWIEADGDLKPLRGAREFTRWLHRVPMLDAEPDRLAPDPGAERRRRRVVTQVG